MSPLQLPWAERVLEFVLEQIPYLEKEMLALADVVQPGDVCFDVGAAGGTYAWLLARRVGPGGRVYAFEPRPRSHRAVAMAQRVLRQSTVSVHQVGLSDSQELKTILVPLWRGVPFTTRAFLASGSDREADAVPAGFTSLRPMTVPMTTMDRFVAEHSIDRVDFIKADVEGAELAMLEGARGSIERWHPSVLLEIEDRHLGRYGRTSSEVVEFMTERGYRMFAFADGALSPLDQVTERENNYLFLPFL